MMEIAVPPPQRELPTEVAEYLQTVADRITNFYALHGLSNTRGFVPSDYATIYHTLQTIREQNWLCGDTFCEWGSGLGVVASLASMLDYDACGIEIDADLFAESLDLAEEFDVSVELVNGSFVPHDADDLIDAAFQENDSALKLETFADDAYEQLGSEIADFDLVFAFPWPDDEELTARIFERFGADGAMLLTYCEQDSVRLRRK